MRHVIAAIFDERLSKSNKHRTDYMIKAFINKHRVVQQLHSLLFMLSIICTIVSIGCMYHSLKDAGAWEDFDSLLKYIGHYSMVYKITFAFIAFWVTVNQLALAHENYSIKMKELDGQQITEESEKSKLAIELAVEYLTTIQVELKEIYQSNIYKGLSDTKIDWVLVTKNELYKADMISFINLTNNLENRDMTNKGLIFLNKLNAWSVKALYSEYNEQVLINIIGNRLLNQFNKIFKHLAIHRDTDNSDFCKETITLYQKIKANTHTNEIL